MTGHRRSLLGAERERYNLVHPTLGTITAERAREIWDSRGNFRVHEDLPMTAEEDQIVNHVWSQMPGSSCFMDAFFIFLNRGARSWHRGPSS